MEQEKAWCLWYFAYILDMFWIYKIWFYFVQVGLTRRQVAGLFLVLRRSQDLLQESDQNEKQRLHKDKKWFGDDPADIKIQLQMQILLERNLFHLFNIFHPKSASTLWQWVSYQKRDQICQMPEISHPNIDSIQHRKFVYNIFCFSRLVHQQQYDDEDDFDCSQSVRRFRLGKVDWPRLAKSRP